MRTIVVKADKTVNFISASSNPWRNGSKNQAQTFRLTHPMVQTTFAKGLRGLMQSQKRTHFAALRPVRTAGASLSAPMRASGPLPGQLGPGNDVPRRPGGDRRHRTQQLWQIITAPATIKIYQNGMPMDQQSTSHGRAFFIPRSLGEYTVTVETVGYKNGQRDVSLVDCR